MLGFLTALWTPDVATVAVSLTTAVVTAAITRLGFHVGPPVPTRPAAPPAAAAHPVLQAVHDALGGAIPGTVNDILLDAAGKIVDRVRAAKQAQQQAVVTVPQIVPDAAP